MHCELIRTQSADGLRLDGVLVQPPADALRRLPIDAALCLHGVGANFYTSSTLDGVRPALLALGLSVLTANTRGHDTVYLASMAMGRRRQGAAYETVDDCRYDIGAWLRWLRERGLNRVLLVGHSLGGIKAVYAQSLERFADVVGVVGISPPRLSHRAFMNSRESSIYFESISTAEELIRAGKPNDLFEAKFPFPLLITAAGYVEKYGPAERYNIVDYVPQLTCPALFVYGSKELEGPPSFAGMPETLRGLPGDSPRQVVVVQDADHNYTGVYRELGAEIARWVGAVFTESSRP
jgi:pimeloyl-ACP methyl ester carboxylesterase